MLINTIINKNKTGSTEPTVGLWGWGLNANNQLGDGTTTNRSSPVFIKSENIMYLESGKDFTFYMTNYPNTGKLWGWGANNLGQLGDGTTTQRSSPVAIMTDKEFMAISCGDTHAAGISQDDSLVSWGQNNHGQLGDGTTTNRSSPVIYTSQYFYQVACGASATIATEYWGGTYPYELYTWGTNSNSRLPQASSSTPVYLDAQTQLTEIYMGGLNGFALGLNDAMTYAWGKNTYGSVGDGTTTDAGFTMITDYFTGPTYILLSPSLSTDGSFTLGIQEDYTLWGWGRNDRGQLGLNNTTDKSSPTLISSESWAYCSAGYDHSVAVKMDGSLWVWGDNRNGQLGDGTTVSKSSMVQIGSGNTYVYVTAGFRFTIAERSS